MSTKAPNVLALLLEQEEWHRAGHVVCRLDQFSFPFNMATNLPAVVSLSLPKGALSDLSQDLWTCFTAHRTVAKLASSSWVRLATRL